MSDMQDGTEEAVATGIKARLQRRGHHKPGLSHDSAGSGLGHDNRGEQRSRHTGIHC